MRTRSGWKSFILALTVLALFSPGPIGRAQEQGSDCEKARELLQKGVEIAQDAPACGEECLGQKEYFYRRAIELCKDYAGAYNNLGALYEKRGRYREAIAEYRRAIALNPNNPTFPHPYFGLGDLYFGRGMLEEAVGYYNDGLKLDPADELSQDRLKIAGSLLRDRKGKDPGKGGEKSLEVIKSPEIIDILGKERMALRGVGPMKESPRLAFRILFATNSDEISKESIPQMNELGKALRSERLSLFSFEVEGHTDYVGNDESNDRLSKKRAESVVKYLAKKFGISARRLIPRPYGKRQPIAFGKDENSKVRNRRVELVRLDAGPESSSSSSPSNLSVEVSFLYQAEGYRFGRMRNGMTLRSGEQYKIYFRPHQECYVYLILVDSKGAYLLFPNMEYHSQGNPLRAQEEYWLPEDKLFTNFFPLDDTLGRETLYLLVLREPAPDIEDLLQRLQAPSKPGEERMVVRGLVDQIELRGPAGPRPGREIRKPVSRPELPQAKHVPVPIDLLEKAGKGLYARISFWHRDKAASRF